MSHWRPHAGAQEEFLTRWEFEVLFGGSAGPGKTDCLVTAMIRDIGNPNYHGLIIRRTFPQLQEIIDRCFRMYPGMGGTYRATDKRWTFQSGAVIDLGHCQHENDKYNYQGKEFHRIGFDELTQFTKTQYTYLHSRIRTTDPGIQPQVLSTTNPGGIGHNWVKERFQPEQRALKTYYDPKTGLSRVFVPATIEDNPTLFENDPLYVSRLESLPEIEKKRLRYGIWDAFEGQVFTELSQRIHGCEPFEIPPEWERYCILDWGFASPFSVGWYAVDYDGVLYRYREWYGCKIEENGVAEGADEGLRMQAWEVAEGIKRREQEAGERKVRRFADPSIWHPTPGFRKKETQGITIEEDFARHGVHFIKADNDRLHGKLQVHKRLQMNEVIDTETGEVMDEEPQIQIFNTCKGFWRTMPELAEDPKNPDDVDTKDQEDHIYDELRYMCMARPVKPRKVAQIPQGSFRAERNKLLRAKKYAQRHGVSVEAAYRKIR